MKNKVIIILAVIVVLFLLMELYRKGFCDGYYLGQMKAIYDSIGK
jgi:hypothetical protein